MSRRRGDVRNLRTHRGRTWSALVDLFVETGLPQFPEAVAERTGLSLAATRRALHSMSGYEVAIHGHSRFCWSARPYGAALAAEITRVTG